jgi:hypothetical protein
VDPDDRLRPAHPFAGVIQAIAWDQSSMKRLGPFHHPGTLPSDNLDDQVGRQNDPGTLAAISCSGSFAASLARSIKVKHPYSRLIAVVCAGFVSLTCFGQSAPPFTTEASASGPAPTHIYAVDVNNDGRTDVIQDTAQPGATGSYFAVSINTGNGTFLPPVTYKVNSNTWTPLTWGDFNHDGKVDIAVAYPPTQIAVYLGNGDGTFQAPITSTFDLPNTTFGNFAQSSTVAADFNKDGNVDLVAAGYEGSDYFAGPWVIYLLEGDGSGHFTNPVPIYYPTSGWIVQTLVAGDFDTDGNADVGLLEYMPCSNGTSQCSSNVLALFGDGGADFDALDVTTINGGNTSVNMTLGAADLNNDGATDLYGIEFVEGKATLAVFPGYYGRQFAYWFTPVPSGIPNLSTLSAVADFNGTGQWALAGLASTATTQNEMIYFLNAGTPNPSIVTGPSPAGDSGWQVPPIVGNFNGDTKPDIAVSMSPTVNSLTSTLAVGVNANTQGFYGGCTYPSSGEGIHLCSPSTTEALSASAPIPFAATANSFGQLRKIELWIDGVKRGEDHFNWGQSSYFNTSLSLSSGTHSATLFAADIDNTLQRYDFNVTVGSQ